MKPVFGVRRSHTAPRGIGTAAAVGVVLITLPIIGMLSKVRWGRLGEVLSDESVRTALWLSLKTSVSATVLSVVIGFPVAWVMAHREFPGKKLVRAVCVLPMVLPPVVGGVALLYAFGRRGLVGSWLESWFGVRLAFTETAAVLAQFFVAVPFFIVVMESAFQQVDPNLAGVARTLGARPWQVVRRVTIPLIMPAFVAGLVLTWARALGEFGATITFAGNTPGRTQTLPLAIYTSLESNGDVALVLSVVLVAISLVVLVSMRSHWLSGATHSSASTGSANDGTGK